MDLSIVIVTYNSADTVARCLESIELNPPAVPFETIVVDNASGDGTVSLVRSRFPATALIGNDTNRGYSKGVNQGVRAASGRFILVLNPDITVDDGSIDRLIEFMERHPRAGIAAARLLWPDGRVQPSCRAFYTIRALLLRRTFLGRLFPRAAALREHLMADFDHQSERRVDWVIGACMIVRREALETVGPMDERFFLYFEDTDWCYRMKQHGFEVWYVPASVMVHDYRRSSARSIFSGPFLRHLLSLLRYYEKWNALFRFLRRHRVAIKSAVFVLGDLAMINAGFFAAYFLRDALQPLFVYGLYPIDWYSIFILFYNLVFLLTFAATGLYSLRRETVAAEEFASVIRSTLIVFAVLLTATYLTRIRIFSRAVLLGQAVFTVVLVTALRQGIRALHRRLVAASFDLKRVAVAGSAAEAREFVSLAAAYPEAGIDVVGRIGTGEDALGPVADLARIVECFGIQEIVMLSSSSGGESVAAVLISPAARAVRVRIVSHLAQIAGRQLRVERVGNVPMFVVERGAAFLVARALQRLIDLTIALILLPAAGCAWLFARAVGAATGRVTFFTETRMGHKGPIAWPRAVRADGREASDLVKPLLMLHLAAGRLSLVGPPAVPAGAQASGGGYRPGISGRWRIERGRAAPKAASDEILILHNESITGRILIMARSVYPCLAGRYPEWFHGMGEER